VGHCNRWHGHKISETDQLKRVLIECWAQLILNTLTPAINQLPKILIMVMNVKDAFKSMDLQIFDNRLSFEN